MPNSVPEEERNEDERLVVLAQLEEWLEKPVAALGFVWLLLLVVELIWGLNPLLTASVYTIWGIFILDFGIRLTLAPQKMAFLRRNWLTMISLIVPALRMVRVAAFVRIVTRSARSLRLVKVVGSLNRGMNALRRALGRRGFGYVILLSVLVGFVGAAGFYAFERTIPAGEGIVNYGDALWYTSMILTTLGSDYWPHTAEGRILTFFLSLYSFAVFGYVTATLASFFIGQDAESSEAEVAGEKSIQSLRSEIQALRAELQAASARDNGFNPPV